MREVGALLALAIVAACTLAAVWSPAGLAGSAVVELWSNYLLIDHGAPWFGPIGAQSTRLLFFVPYKLVRLAGGESFASLQLAMILALGAKALLAFAIVRRLGWPAHCAMAVGLLLMIYPGGEATFPARYLNFHCTLDLMLAAVWVWLVHLTRPRWFLPPLYWALTAASLLLYEVAFPLAVTAPALALAARAPLAPRRRWLVASALWYTVPAVYVLWALLGGELSASYQVETIGAEPLAERLAAAASAYGACARNLFASAWRKAVLALGELPFRDVVLAIGVGVLGAAGIGVALRLERDSVDTPPAGRGAMRASLVAMSLLILSLAPFALAVQLRESGRAFLGAMLGAAPLVVLAVRKIAEVAPRRWRPAAFAAVFGLLFALAAGAGLAAQREILALSRLEQQVLADIARAVPAPPRRAVLLLSDPDRVLEEDLLFGWKHTDGHFADAVRFLYGRFDLYALGWRPPGPRRWAGRAEARTDGVAVVLDGREIAKVGYERVAFFVVQPDGRARLAPLPVDDFPNAGPAYAPGAWPVAAPPRRTSGFLPLAMP